MRILHLVNTLNPRGGGVTEAVKQFGLTLSEYGHPSTIVSLDASSSDWHLPQDVEYHALGPAITQYGYCAQLKAWLKNNTCNYDAVITHGLWQYHGLAVRSVCLKAGVRYFVFAHGMLDEWFKIHYPLKHLKKWLFWPWADYRILRDASAVIYTSEFERLSSRKSFWLYRCREKVVNYGITLPEIDPDAAREAFLQRFPQLRNKRFLLFLGRIHVKKGLDLLARAWSELDPATRPELVIAGPAEEPEFLKAVLRVAGEKSVHCPGMLEGDLKWGAFAAADAMILPSHQENFGLVVAESLYMGTPVLISNKVNIWSEIKNAQVGILADDTLEGTRSLLKRWESMPVAERDAMSSKARAACTKLFDLRKNTQELINLLEPA